MGDEKGRVAGPGHSPDEDEKTMVRGPSRQIDGGEEVVRLGAQQEERDLEAVADETLVEFRRPTPAGEALLGWLVVKSGRRRGQLYTLASECTIGRKAADIALDDDSKVSKIHAKLAVRGGQFVIVDVLSDNGTFLNGERINSERVLQENDEIRIGDTLLVLKTLPPEKKPGPPTAGNP